MITGAEREAAFRKDLKKLLIKHGAMLDAFYDPYTRIGTLSGVTVTMPAVQGDVTRDCKKGYTEFEIDLDKM